MENLWSSGYITKGKIKARINKKNEDFFDSNALTIGMDKIIKKYSFGIAISQDHQHTDIGQLGTEH